MSRVCDILLILLIAVLILLLTGTQFAQANEADQPEIVVIRIASTPTPSQTPEPTLTPMPTPRPRMSYNEYDWDSATIDAVASVYWGECNTAQEKMAVTALLFNRWLYGPPFGGSLEEVAAQPGEFNVGRVSDANRELARVNLNKVLTQYYGDYAGVAVPRSAVYMDRINGVLTFYDDTWEIVWEVA